MCYKCIYIYINRLEIHTIHIVTRNVWMNVWGICMCAYMSIEYHLWILNEQLMDNKLINWDLPYSSSTLNYTIWKPWGNGTYFWNNYQENGNIPSGNLTIAMENDGKWMNMAPGKKWFAWTKTGDFPYGSKLLKYQNQVL